MPAHLHLAAPPASGYAGRRARPIRVVLADDHLAVRRGLRLLLNGEDDVEVVAEAPDLTAALTHVHRHAPHVLVLDLQLSNGSSLDTIRQLRTRAPETAIVVVTMETSSVFADRALEAGALGYVLKERADSDLPAAVRAAVRGEEWVSPPVAARLEAFRDRRGQDGLTARELEVLRLVALGFTSQEIACQLHLSRRTIESNRMRIQRKLGVETRAELVAYALRRQLIGP